MAYMADMIQKKRVQPMVQNTRFDVRIEEVPFKQGRQGQDHPGVLQGLKSAGNILPHYVVQLLWEYDLSLEKVNMEGLRSKGNHITECVNACFRIVRNGCFLLGGCPALIFFGNRPWQT